jgi:hypothetical protein
MSSDNRASLVIVLMANLTRINLFSFTSNFIRKAKQKTIASMILSHHCIKFRNNYLLRFRHAFATFDKNHDGTIDFEEFLLSVSVTNSGSDNDRLAAAFDM